jgi:class 3 adenylate cyclase
MFSGSNSSKLSSRLGGSIFLRYAGRRLRLLAPFLVIGLIVGVAYRSLIDDPATRDLANYLRSGLHGVGIALTAWIVQTEFASRTQSGLGSALRRLPVLGELAIRSLVITAALIIVGVLLQLALYAESLRLHWFNSNWLSTTLPRIVVIGFVISMFVGALTETARLLGRRMLTSVLLGTYHRPVSEQLIVMFLDIAGSTQLAEEMGELRVHDLITRFFFDIDEPISDHGGSVHAYVGDEVIVTWPVTDDPVRNSRCLSCFSAIERKMARVADTYDREFGAVPSFRAGVHAGSVIVSECGDAKRQLAYFGDTMNVAARLCEYCKASNKRLVVSGYLLHQAKLPTALGVGNCESIALRGRRERVETHVFQ